MIQFNGNFYAKKLNFTQKLQKTVPYLHGDRYYSCWNKNLQKDIAVFRFSGVQNFLATEFQTLGQISLRAQYVSKVTLQFLSDSTRLHMETDNFLSLDENWNSGKEKKLSEQKVSNEQHNLKVVH